jgi:hypothetical protein
MSNINAFLFFLFFPAIFTISALVIAFFVSMVLRKIKLYRKRNLKGENSDY